MQLLFVLYRFKFFCFNAQFDGIREVYRQKTCTVGLAHFLPHMDQAMLVACTARIVDMANGTLAEIFSDDASTYAFVIRTGLHLKY